VAVVTGVLTAQIYFDISPRTFLNFQQLSSSDLLVGFTKCIAYGSAIPIISGHAGLTTFGGSEGVGSATTRAVVNSSLAVVVMNFFISGAGYLVFGQ
jgi:phospholipid/cholesterol/gamma-HCH transport system permease protein